MFNLYLYLLLFSFPVVYFILSDIYTPIFNEIGLKGIVVNSVKVLPNGKELIIRTPCNISTVEIEKEKLKIEQSLNCKLKVEYLDKQKVKLVLYENKLPDRCNLITDDTKELLEIPIGISNKGMETVNLMEHDSNMLIAGMPGSGKSTLMKAIIDYILKVKMKFYPGKIDLYLCDLKGGLEFGKYKKEKVKRYALDINQVVEVLDYLKLEIERRMQLFYEKDSVNLEEFNSVTENQLPYIVCFIDEFASLTDNENKKLMEHCIFLLTYIGRMGRAFGIRMIIATQRPDSKVIPGSIKSNYNIKVCFKVADKTNSVIVIEQKGAEELKGQGHGLLNYKSELTEFKAFIS